ncbi:pilus assembly protein [Mangrovibacillus cuniculi]|uniref:Pilus assembly protein n=2 Tax=Mangrovibacillus cuniculi TaxID=2593652 RepID=A0A7S8CEK9_9BACI|nr:pilus assembly protein [Mangrovibacillus cuniculi]
MKRWKKRLQNEKGALSLELLGILPFFFLFFLLLWQVLGTGYAVLTTKSAVNDAAKVFATTKDINEAKDIAIAAIGDSSVLQYEGIEATYIDSAGGFTLNLKASHTLSFIPDMWKKEASFTLEEEAVGRVLTP